MGVTWGWERGYRDRDVAMGHQGCRMRPRGGAGDMGMEWIWGVMGTRKGTRRQWDREEGWHGVGTVGVGTAGMGTVGVGTGQLPPPGTQQMLGAGEVRKAPGRGGGVPVPRVEVALWEVAVPAPPGPSGPPLTAPWPWVPAGSASVAGALLPSAAFSERWNLLCVCCPCCRSPSAPGTGLGAPWWPPGGDNPKVCAPQVPVPHPPISATLGSFSRGVKVRDASSCAVPAGTAVTPTAAPCGDRGDGGGSAPTGGAQLHPAHIVGAGRRQELAGPLP